MSLTAKDVAEILRLLEDSSFDELDLEAGGVKLSLRRRGDGGVGDAPSTASRSASPRGGGSRLAGSSPPEESPEGREGGSQAQAPADPDAAEVPSPLLGVFYRAPKPGEAPFVEIGSKVEAETIIGIIEVMKLMNTVRAGVAGEVSQILAENGALVEYGETLMRVRRAG